MQSKQAIQQQMFAMIEQWQQSGLTQKAYCIQNNIAYHIFHYWYRCYRHNQSATDPDSSSFVKLQVSSPAIIAHTELLLPDGKRLLFHQPVSSDYLKALIR